MRVTFLAIPLCALMSCAVVEARNQQFMTDCYAQANRLCPVGRRYTSAKWSQWFFQCMCQKWTSMDGGEYTCQVGCFRDLDESDVPEGAAVSEV
ncbi:hypothetical protein OC834_004940 [Tilletia horrida]|uniref:Secreted protein n=1 Tax=Tilletia horrida TaxID=155126 RepID=A0AAN6GII2_9BASI|nr:hypothetical protein OC834_004940 [Tilletia horrida]KAK0535874.1 hypothetical protein OC842_002172 [Tilletia horrida]KAK0538591.1 hypothetical protein OC835_001393 [Tilletia horrida]KAK0558601.1 hypothetical protein OC844_005026 [Tilletia horrida]